MKLELRRNYLKLYGLNLNISLLQYKSLKDLSNVFID